MHKALHRIRLVHSPDPRTEARVGQAVAEAADSVADDEDGPRRVHGEDDKRGDVAQRRHDGDAASAEAHVNLRIGHGGDGVAGEGSQEDEGDDGVAEVVVFLELGKLVALGGRDLWSHIRDQSLDKLVMSYE